MITARRAGAIRPLHTIRSGALCAQQSASVSVVHASGQVDPGRGRQAFQPVLAHDQRVRDTGFLKSVTMVIHSFAPSPPVGPSHRPRHIAFTLTVADPVRRWRTEDRRDITDAGSRNVLCARCATRCRRRRRRRRAGACCAGGNRNETVERLTGCDARVLGSAELALEGGRGFLASPGVPDSPEVGVFGDASDGPGA